MHSLDIRQSLGVVAVAALVITGLPASAGAAPAPVAAAEVGSVEITPPDTETKRPGQSTDTFGVTVRAPDGSPLAGETVTLSVDSGYFTPLANRPEVPEDLGETRTVTTDQNGVASFKIAIGRDTGFDDDGEVLSTITATAGGVSDTEDQLFVSSEPVNGSAVDLVRFESDDAAATARYDVLVFDEFGNPVAGEQVSLTDRSESVETPATATSVLRPTGTVEVVASGGVRERTKITAAWISTNRGSAEPVTFSDVERVVLDDRPVPTLEVVASDNGARPDRLLVDGTRLVAGDVVQVLRLRPGREASFVVQRRADRRGDVRVAVPDANGRRRTAYVAVVAGSPDHAPATSAPVRVR